MAYNWTNSTRGHNSGRVLTMRACACHADRKIGNATRHGFIVREGDALERLASVKVVAFDKTGTLTHGTPEAVAAHSMHDGVSDDELYRLTASAEQMSEHPLGKGDCGRLEEKRWRDR